MNTCPLCEAPLMRDHTNDGHQMTLIMDEKTFYTNIFRFFCERGHVMFFEKAMADTLEYKPSAINTKKP